MKKTIVLIGVAALALATVNSARAVATYIPPQGQYIDGTSNMIVNAAGVAAAANSIAANSTNWFNLSVTPGAQPNTNLWPAISFSQWGAPSRFISADAWCASGAANVGVTTYAFVPSPDGSRWLTNQPFILNVTNNGTVGSCNGQTIDLGGNPFMCLWYESNTNTTTFITNNAIRMVSKPNL